MSQSRARAVAAAAITIGSVVAISGSSPRVAAAGFLVDSTGDSGDANPGDGTCATAGGVCTLRAAIEEANANGTDDGVQVPPGTYSIGSALEITNKVIDIHGSGNGSTIIDGPGTDRIFDIVGGALTLRDVHLTGGGGVQAGGAIYLESGGLQITDTIIKDNEAFTGGGAIFIDENQKFDIRKTEFESNTATGAFGGALWNAGDGKVLDSLFVDNDGNRAGAIHNNTEGLLRLRNVTVSGNEARSDTGGTGGVHNNGFLVMNNVTITKNTGFDRAGGILTTTGATTVMKNSIVADNDDTADVNEDCEGDFSADSRYNLIGETSVGCGLPGSTTTWLLDVDAELFPLFANGGPTRTHSFPSDAPPRDAGFPFPPGGPAADSCEENDQRGIQRLKCDIGAYEFEVAVPATIDVFVDEDGVDVSPGDGECATATGSCTLRAAVQESNWLPGTQTISLSGNTYELTVPAGSEAVFDPAAVGDLDVLDDVIIEGFVPEPDIVTIDANDMYRVFDVHPGTSAVVRGLTVTGGSDAGGGGIRVSTAQLNLQSVRVIGNESQVSGGGIATGGIDEVITISDSQISNNTAPFLGGGGAGIDASGTITITDTTISGNVGTGSGAGIRASGTVELTRVRVIGNETTGASNSGGGVSASGLTMTESLIFDNESAAHGGGLFGSGLVTNTTIYGNTAGTRGGGVSTSGDLTLRNVTVAENVAADNGNSALVFGSTAELHLDNTILTSTAAGDECDGVAPTSVGHNLADDATCNLSAVGDMASTASSLGPLADNGGPTNSAEPQPGSAAIDNGSDVGLVTDQRGFGRPGGAGFDIGAIEVGGANGLSILLVAGNAGPLAPDQQYVDRFTAAGYSVVVVDDDSVTAADADGTAAVFISSTVVPSKVGDTFAASATPVVVAEVFVLARMGMTGSGTGDRREQSGINAINIVDPGNPIAGGLTGYRAHSVPSAPVGWARPAASATTIATAGGATKSAVFTYDAGDPMVDGVAPAKRAFVYPSAQLPTAAAAATWTLIDGVVDWAVD